MLRKFSIKECQNNYKNNQMKESFEEDDLVDDYLESLRNKRNAYREGFDYKELARQLNHIRAVHNPDVDLWGVVMALISSYGYDVTGSGYEEEFDPEQIEGLENSIGIYKDYISKQIPNLERKICPLAKKLLPSYDFTWMDE